MKLRLPLLLLSAILGGMSSPSIYAVEETIVWDADAVYNQSRTLIDKTPYTFTFTGSSGNTFSFNDNTAGVFYWKPNGGGDLTLQGADPTLNLEFSGNTLDGKTGDAASGPVIHNYNGTVLISQFGKLTVSNNTSGYNGGAFYVYKGGLTFDNIQSIEFTGNVAERSGGVIAGISANITFSNIAGDILFAANEANNATADGGSVIVCNGGAITFSNVGGKILVENNIDASRTAAIRGKSILFENVKGGVVFKNNQSRAFHSNSTITFQHIEGGLFFEGHAANASTKSQGGTMSADGAGKDGTLVIVFSDIEGGITVRNSTGCTGAGISAVNEGNILFDTIVGDVLFEDNTVLSGPAAAIRGGNLTMSNIKGNLTFSNNKCDPKSVSKNYGGAIYVSATEMLADIATGAGLIISKVSGNVIFTGNEANSTGKNTRGGAIYSGTNTAITDVGGNIEFLDNKANSLNETGDAGAIYAKGKVTLAAEGAIIFSENEAETNGATIYSSSDVTLNAGKGGILFEMNKAGGRGGALYTLGGVLLESDDAIIFRANEAKSDGATIYGLSDVTLNAGEEGILFEKNSAGGKGGAFYAMGGVFLESDGAITFNYNDAKGDGGAIYALELTMTAGEGGISFEGNSSSGNGGAINVGKALILKASEGNILFAYNSAGNDETGGNGRKNDVYIRKVFSGGSKVILDAAEDRTLTFEGSVEIEYSADIAINTGEESTGMVVFNAENGGIIASQAEGAAQNITIGGGTVIISSIQGQGTVNLSSDATLISGFTSVVVAADGSKTLQTTSGFENYTAVFNIEAGAEIGSNIFNFSDDIWYIHIDDLKASQALAWQGIESANNAQFGSMNLRGNVMLNNAELDENETLIIGDGAWASISGEIHGNVVLQGGTLDVSEMSSPTVAGDNINGSGGSLITHGSQTVIYLQDSSLGYDVLGKEGNSGANIQVGNDANTPSVTTGGTWHSDSIELQGGTTIALESAIIGSGNIDATMTVLGGARFENQGATVKNTLRLKQDAQISGSGNYQAIELEDGSRVDIGGAKGGGFLVVDSLQRVETTARALSANNGSTLGFMVDGGTAASLGNTGAGTFSHISAQTIDLTGISIEITLGDHLANLGSKDFSLSLIKGINEGGNILQEFILLGRSDLVEDGSLSLSWTGDSLNFAGTLNSSVVMDILSPEGSRLANVLWSNTRSLSTFSQLATSQLNSIHAGATNIWGSGFGDFTSASNAGSVSGFDYQGGGYAMGIDHGFKVHQKDRVTAGLAFGQSFGSHQSNDTLLNIHQRGVMAALYSRYAKNVSEKQSWDLTGSFAYGDTDNWGMVGLEAGNGAPRHTWNSEAFSADLMFRWRSKISDSATLTPFVGISYIYGSQENITLQGNSSERSFTDSSLQRWVVPVGLEYSRLTSFSNGQKLLSFMSLAYQGDVARNDASVKMNVLGAPSKVKGTQPGRSAFVLNTGCQWAITPQWSASAAYNLELRSEMTQQSVTATLSYSF